MLRNDFRKAHESFLPNERKLPKGERGMLKRTKQRTKEKIKSPKLSFFFISSLLNLIYNLITKI